VTTPLQPASSYFYTTTEQLDRVFAGEEEGYCYSRYTNPTNAALEEQVRALENGHGALACASGMAALQTAILVALADRPKSILAAHALYGATYKLLFNILEPMGISCYLVDICDAAATGRAIAEQKPGCVLLETISNPLLRVAPLDRMAEIAREAGAALVVDNTFATPLLLRPIEFGANLVVHSLTKYLSGHGDVLGGVIVSDKKHWEPLRTYSRVVGPVLGPFEAYLAMRGIKTFPLRMERQCANARRLAAWLREHPRVARVHYPDDPAHPDADTVSRLLTGGYYGGIVSFEIEGVASRQDVFAFMDRLRLVVRSTSLGDVHTMILYPVMSSHRDVAPKQRQRMGIGENLLRISTGIEAIEDVISDLAQALS
jgi:cystathionine gamma-synthase/methionine-gamma-lyase